MMRKWVVSVLMLLPLLLGGCDYHELDNTVLVVGLGIERTDDGAYQISAEIVTMDKGGIEEYKPQIVIAEGKTALEATSNARGLVAQRLDFSHCQVVVFDEEVCREGIASLVSSLLAFDELSINTYCMVSVGSKPKEVLAAPALTSRTQSIELNSALVDEIRRDNASWTSLLHLYNNIYNEQAVTVVPRLIIKTVGDQSLVDLDGAVVLNADRYAGELERTEVVLYTMTEDAVMRRVYAIPYDGDYFSIQVENSTSKLETRMTDGRVQAKIRLSLLVNLIGGYPHEMGHDEVIGFIRTHFEESLYGLVQKGWNEMDCDLFTISNQLHRQYPNAFSSVGEWHALVRNADYQMEVRIRTSTDDIIEDGGRHAKQNDKL